MNNKLDIQSLQDVRNVTIDRVGVKNVKYPIVVEDRTNKIQHTIADLDIFVELPHNQRGTHMSRFIEVLNRYHEETLVDNLPTFLTEIKNELSADVAYVSIKFPYFISKIAPVSKISSLMSYNCDFTASLSDIFNLSLGIEIPITTLCPCSKEISDYGAHNQRSIVRVTFAYKEFVWLEEIIEIVESCASSQIYSLLKRVDEKYVTEQAYNNPMFVEDIVREIYLKLQSDNRITTFTVESENFESIHNHNAYAFVTSK
ncbi:MAG: GTP cyclohydrolase FolE2 [Candidatus Cloacimonetes bacterium]|nr:GTP cyclohydrolase FolE2 [Candidatus Cloacimonadota bacterium]